MGWALPSFEHLSVNARNLGLGVVTQMIIQKVGIGNTHIVVQKKHDIPPRFAQANIPGQTGVGLIGDKIPQTERVVPIIGMGRFAGFFLQGVTLIHNKHFAVFRGNFVEIVQALTKKNELAPV